MSDCPRSLSKGEHIMDKTFIPRRVYRKTYAKEVQINASIPLLFLEQLTRVSFQSRCPKTRLRCAANEIRDSNARDIWVVHMRSFSFHSGLKNKLFILFQKTQGLVEKSGEGGGRGQKRRRERREEVGKRGGEERDACCLRYDDPLLCRSTFGGSVK